MCRKKRGTPPVLSEDFCHRGFFTVSRARRADVINARARPRSPPGTVDCAFVARRRGASEAWRRGDCLWPRHEPHMALAGAARRGGARAAWQVRRCTLCHHIVHAARSAHAALRGRVGVLGSLCVARLTSARAHCAHKVRRFMRPALPPTLARARTTLRRYAESARSRRTLRDHPCAGPRRRGCSSVQRRRPSSCS